MIPNGAIKLLWYRYKKTPLLAYKSKPETEFLNF